MSIRGLFCILRHDDSSVAKPTIMLLESRPCAPIKGHAFATDMVLDFVSLLDRSERGPLASSACYIYSHMPVYLPGHSPDDVNGSLDAFLPAAPALDTLLGDAAGKGDSADANPGDEKMQSHWTAPEVQSFLSRDPQGPGKMHDEPSQSTQLPGDNAASAGDPAAMFGVAQAAAQTSFATPAEPSPPSPMFPSRAQPNSAQSNPTDTNPPTDAPPEEHNPDSNRPERSSPPAVAMASTADNLPAEPTPRLQAPHRRILHLQTPPQIPPPNLRKLVADILARALARPIPRRRATPNPIPSPKSARSNSKPAARTFSSAESTSSSARPGPGRRNRTAPAPRTGDVDSRPQPRRIRQRHQRPNPPILRQPRHRPGLQSRRVSMVA